MTAPTNSRLEQVTRPFADCPILGGSPAIHRAIGLAMRFAPTDLPVFLVGPTGSGKELFARQIHQWSGRRGPLVDINAGALPRDMVESLLFGHRRGAFTGAVQSTQGLITAAGTGSLFLDELTSLPLEGQAKLLRAIESGEIRALGETVNRPVRCRFIAAVQQDVDARISRGEFRADLYQRMAGIVIRLPALAERPEDLLLLADAFARERGATLTAGIGRVLLAYQWPGNVRELRAAVHRASLLSDGGTIEAADLRDAIELSAVHDSGPGGTPATPAAKDGLIDLCEAHGWDVERAAESIGVDRSTLYRRLRHAGVYPAQWRKLPRRAVG